MPSSHIVKRGTIYHVRIDIPAALRPAFGNQWIRSKSLRTGDALLARELAARQVAEWKLQFRQLREAQIRRGDGWKDDAAKASKTLSGFLNEMVLDAMGVQALPEVSQEEIDRIKGSGEVYDPLIHGKVTPIASHTFDITDKSPSEAVSEYQKLTEFFKDGIAHQLVAEYGLTKGQTKEARGILADHKTYKPKSPLSKSLQERFAAHYATQTANERTRSVTLSKIKAFSDWLTAEGRVLTWDSVADFLDVKSRNRQTRAGYLSALNKVHRWACRYDHYYREQFASAPSPFAGHEHPRVGKEAGDSWAAYTKEEAEQLHAAAVAKGDADLADLIAFACLTGCRIEELGRISTDTTLFDEKGQLFAFKVLDAKTKAGIREIPVHPDLLPIYNRRLAAHKDGYLFPGNSKTKSGIRLNALSQRFTKLKRAEGFGDRHVFHSFRKCTTTLLEQLGASALVIPSILGHTRGSLTFDIYSAGASMSQKAEAIRLLSFDFENHQEKKD